MVCLQETKCFEFGTSSNTGGTITMWRKSCLQLLRYSNGNNFSIIEGVWKIGGNVQVTIVNVYCSGSLRDKKTIWDEICGVRTNHSNWVWCVVGDFNAIRRKEERNFFVFMSDYISKIREFNNFLKGQNCWIS